MELYIEGFIWMDWVVEKIVTKHGVSPDEVEQCFFNAPFKLLRGGSDKYKFMSRSDGGRYLAVIFAWEDHWVKVISARDMDAKERRYYGSK